MLNYIGPTLEKHKGCDILDINPGAGLWSQKLHDFLQPRSHVLFESSPNDYSEFLDPLVKEPGSKYKIVGGDIRDFIAHDRVLDEGVFPHQEYVDPASPEAQQPNNTLLVTGQLMWDPKAPGWNFDSLARQMIITFARNASMNKGIHRYGLIRSLFWMTEDEFKPCVPRSHHFFSKYSVLMRALSSCTQVVTAGHAPKTSGHGTIARDAQYEIQSVMRAMNRGRKNGQELPKHRREDIHDFAEDIEKLKGSDGRLTAAEAQAFFWEKIREGKSPSGLALESFIDIVRTSIALEKNPTMFKDTTTPRQKRLWKNTPEGNKYAAKKSSTNQAQRLKIKMEASAIHFEAVYDQEVKILGMKDGPEKDAALQELESLMDTFQTGLNNLPLFRHSGTMAEGNERISLRVPRLDWDMRPYEPLVMKEDEVWPRNRIALLDMEPRPLLKNQKVSFESILEFIYGLFGNPSGSIIKALEAMQPGASQIVDDCPSLRDPKKGGRLNLDLLFVNMLTNEMIAELALAFKEWPFRDDRVGSSFLHSMMDGKGETLEWET